MCGRFLHIKVWDAQRVHFISLLLSQGLEEKADCVPEYGPKMFCKCCPSGRYDPLPPVDEQTGFFLAQSLRLFQSLFNPATAQLPPAKQRL